MEVSAMDDVGYSPAIVRLFGEDLVAALGRPSRLGIVSEVAGDSDSEDEDEENAARRHVPDGHALVCWEDGPVSLMEKISRLRVVDRSLMHGDVVVRASDPLGQTGTVVSVAIKVDLKLPGGEKVLGVSSECLRPVRAIEPGNHVVRGSWLGQVEDIEDVVTVEFGDGARCKVFGALPEDLRSSVLRALDDEADCPYFPGQKVTAFPRFFKRSQWLRGTWNANRKEATVVEVDMGKASVRWIAAGKSLSAAVPGNDSGISPPPPPGDVKASELVPFTFFKASQWQLGDWARLPGAFLEKAKNGCDLAPSELPAERVASLKPEEANADGGDVLKDQDPERTEEPLHLDNGAACHVAVDRRRKKRRAGGRREEKGGIDSDELAEVVLAVTATRTTVSVIWQDGSRCDNLEAAALIPMEYFGDQDFWPGDFVEHRVQEEEEEKGEQADAHNLKASLESPRQGFVKSVNFKERTAVVCWWPSTHNVEVDMMQAGEAAPGVIDTVSVYELVGHTDFKFGIGDVVVKLTGAYLPLQNGGAADAEGAQSADLDNSSGRERQANSASLKEFPGTAADVFVLPGTEAGGEQREYQAAVRDVGGDEASMQELATSGKSCSGSLWAGEVIGLVGGKVQIAWSDGTISMVAPQSVVVVSQEGDEDGSEEYDGDDAASWETMDGDDDNEGRVGVGLTVDDVGERREETEGQNWSADDERRQLRWSGLPPSGIDQNPQAVPSQPAEEVTPVPAWVQPRPRPSSMGSLMSAPLAIPRLGISLAARLAAALLGRLPPVTDQGLRMAKELFRSPGGRGEPPTLANGSTSSASTSSAGTSSAAKSPRALQQEGLPTLLWSLDSSDPGSNATNASRALAGSDPELAQPLEAEAQGQRFPEEGRGGSDGSSGIQRIPAPCRRDESAQIVSTPDGSAVAFRQFDVTSVPSDHFFIGETAQATDRKWAKKVQQEWAILQKSLPETVYVRVFEERMDLMRAAILGPPGTPYHDNIFMFDFWLPPSFPDIPPVAHYHSWGLRVNPNLYESGKVCLSLLNTWNGRGSEVWSSHSSTVLQVLVSIQGLVLVPKPYFNEAGYERQVATAEGEKNAAVHNESVFLQSCKSMLFLLRRPPQHFKPLVQAHFRSRAADIITSCEAYIGGAPIGSLSGTSGVPAGNAAAVGKVAAGNQVEGDASSEGFKLMLRKLLPRLQAAFHGLVNSNPDTGV